MFNVAIRIPYEVLGMTQYVNGSFRSDIPFEKAERVQVRCKVVQASTVFVAEVIEAVRTAKAEDTTKFALVG